MQVLDFQAGEVALGSPPVLQEQSLLSTDQTITHTQFNDLINDTMAAINQTLKQIVDQVKDNHPTQTITNLLSFEDDWNMLYFLRMLFYIVVVLKLLQLVFSKRKKMDIKERVYRKYVFSYAEMIREFDDDDRNIMNTTLKNTIKNAAIEKNLPKMVKKQNGKRVIFHETKNEYIEPVRREEGSGNEALSALQMFLSRGDKVELLDMNMFEKKEGDREEDQPKAEQQLEEVTVNKNELQHEQVEQMKESTIFLGNNEENGEFSSNNQGENRKEQQGNL